MDSNFRVQIASFASTRPSGAAVTGLGVNHPRFVAPELLEISEHGDDPAATITQMSDVYAFGCLYYEVSCSDHADPLADFHRSIIIKHLFSVYRRYRP